LECGRPNLKTDYKIKLNIVLMWLASKLQITFLVR